MSLELNLWFSARTGNVYGNLNINQKESVENISQMLPIDKFCSYGIKYNHTTEEQLQLFINDPNTDHDALYGWTEKSNMICWNKNNNYSIVMYNDNIHTLNLITTRRTYKGMPDIYFRG